METYIKVADGIFVLSEPVTPKIIKISELEQEVAKIDEELQQPMPPDEELINLGKSMHPYYLNLEWQLAKKTELINLINYLKTV